MSSVGSAVIVLPFATASTVVHCLKLIDFEPLSNFILTLRQVLKIDLSVGNACDWLKADDVKAQ